VEASGASSVEARMVAARTATVEASGASRVTVDVSDKLTANVSGASTVCFVSEPADLSGNASGTSTVGECP
jgi:hypothetical protein